MRRLRASSAHPSSFMARKPPMFASPSFFADIVHPSARENISCAISFGVRCACPFSRSLMK